MRSALTRSRLGLLGILTFFAVALALGSAGSSFAVAADGRAVGVSGAHACAITAEGSVKCWGDNRMEQLGVDPEAVPFSATPVTISGLETGVTALTVGWAHACVIQAGGVKCWGWNAYGHLGQHVPPRGEPLAGVHGVAMPVDGLESGVTAISTGARHTCAIQNGAARCFGFAQEGALGVPAEDADELTVHTVQGLGSGVSAIAATDDYTCAVHHGAVKCWGTHGGRIGDGEPGIDWRGSMTYPSIVWTPAQVVGLTEGVTGIAASYSHTCALQSGAAWCWGSNFNEQIVPSETPHEPVLTPVAVTSLGTGLAQIQPGSNSTCARVGAELICIGAGSEQTPVELTGPGAGLSDVATNGGSRGCGVVDAVLKCWGANNMGQLGDGTTEPSPVPVVVAGFGAPYVPVDDNDGNTDQDPAGEPGGDDPGNPVDAPGQPNAPPAGSGAPERPAPVATPQLPLTAITPLVQPQRAALISSRRSLRAGSRIAVRLDCPDSCKLVRVLKIGKRKVKGVRAVRLTAGESQRVTFRLPSRAVRQVRGALRKNPKTKVTLTLTPSNKVGKGKSRVITIRH